MAEKPEKLRGSAEPVPGKCGCKLRNSDPPRYCLQNPAAGRSRCRLHGGASAKGPEHYRWGSGRYGVRLNSEMREVYEDMVSDSKALDLRDELALLRARLSTLLQAQTDGMPRPPLELLGDAAKAWRALRARPDKDQAAKLATEIDAMLGPIVDPASDWQEITDLVDRIGTVALRHHRINEVKDGTVPMDVLVGILGVFLELLIQHYHAGRIEKRVITEIMAEYEQRVGPREAPLALVAKRA